MSAFSGSGPLAPKKQAGQAFWLVLMFTVITTVLGISVLTNGILVTEKMEMQNAADAAAFSVSSAEARDLNFASYTNRAMVANEIAMGQVLSFMSWATMIQKTGPTLALYFYPVTIIIKRTPAAPVAEALVQFFNGLTSFGKTLAKVMETITKPVSQGISIMNAAYSASQRALNIATLGLSVFIIQEMLENNDQPNYSGAPPPSISGFGFVALAGHFLTHYADLAIPNLVQNGAFITSYKQDTDSRTIPHFNPAMKPQNPEQKAGMERFAAMVNSNRDKYTKNRDGGFSFDLSPLLPPIGIDVCVLCIPATPITPAIKPLEVTIGIKTFLNRRGGAAVRYRANGSSTAKTQNYGWSAADVSSVDFVPRIRVAVFGAGVSVDFPGIGVPVGVGATQAATPLAELGADRFLPVANMRYPGKVLGSSYGDSPSTSFLVWLSGWPAIPSPIDAGGRNELTTQGPSQTIAKYNWVDSYRLPRYNDTKNGPDPINLTKKTLGFESPYLIIGLTKDADTLQDQKSIGRLAPAQHHADGEIGVIAKSEVYFSRPSDVPYLMRADGKTEYANAFNPYWSARLVDTSVLDRITALGMQQEQAWLPDTGIGPVMDDLSDLLAWFN
ncbi:MAG: hypothetical protein ACI9LY_003130 [Arenicella sp.]|jgi:hypothetical protein